MALSAAERGRFDHPPDLPLGAIADAAAGEGAVLRALVAGGLSTEASRRAAGGFRRAAQALLQTGFSAETPAAALWVPGRIEVLGKHTDYAGGRSLLVAIERGFSVVSAAGGTGVRVLDARREGTARRVDEETHPATVIRGLRRFDPYFGASDAPGAAVAFSSSLPSAAGMSSSSALVTGLSLALAAPARLRLPTEVTALADALAAIEAGVGTAGGSEDHAAILCARPGEMIRCAFPPTRLEGRTPLPVGWTFALAASGVRASKAGRVQDAYNRLSAEARDAGERWMMWDGHEGPDIGRPGLFRSAPDVVAVPPEGRAHLGSLLTASPGAVASFLDALPESALRARIRQFLEECNELIPAVEDALARGAPEEAGVPVDRSQRLAEDVLGNQVPETVHLSRSARLLGAAAASSFGAGFGGAVWALVPSADLDRFLEAWRRDYLGRFPERAGDVLFFESPAGPPAFRLAPSGSTDSAG